MIVHWTLAYLISVVINFDKWHFVNCYLLTLVISKNAGPGSLGVYIEGPSEAKTTFKDNKDGTCSLAYLPTKPGEYNIVIKYEDESIPDSPFHAMIYPTEYDLLNKPDPTKVKMCCVFS